MITKIKYKFNMQIFIIYLDCSYRFKELESDAPELLYLKVSTKMALVRGRGFVHSQSTFIICYQFNKFD